MVTLIVQGWRNQLKALATSARDSLVIVAPYIKRDQAKWLCELLNDNVAVVTLSSIESVAVSAEALDIEALLQLSTATSASRLYHVPSLHAKIFIADNSAAIVTSGNLTQPGLDNNLEFGVFIDDPAQVQEVQGHMRDYMRRGSLISPDKLERLLPVQQKLREEKALLEAATDSITRELFDDLLKETKTSSDESNKSKRESNIVLGEAVLKILASRDMRTQDIHERIQNMHPELCDDSVPRYRNGPSNGSEWRSRVRHALDNHKKYGRITFDAQHSLYGLTDKAQSSSR